MENFIYTGMICEECGADVVLCPRRAELYCLKCGLIKEASIPLSMLGYLEYAAPTVDIPSEEKAQAFIRWG